MKPKIVCLCGSTRFGEAFRKANLNETLAGRIVLTVGCDFKSDDALGLTADVKTRLDALHLCKIDLADEIIVLNVDGYIGQSTQREIAYAVAHGKDVRFLEIDNGERYLERMSLELGHIAAGFLRVGGLGRRKGFVMP